MPQISVIMPAYNCGPYIAEAIDSILNQTFPDFELIICDDGSTDNTWSVIESYTDRRIRKYRHEKNKGYLAAYNYLLTFVTGEFVTCQDADDWSDKSRLELQYNLLISKPDVALCGVNGVFYYTEEIQNRCAPIEEGYVTNTPKPFTFMLAAVMYRRSVLDRVKGFHIYFDRLTSMDQYFIMDILAHYKGYAIPQYLYYARFNPGSNHRTLDHNRKLTAHEAYLLLKRQRLETGSDWLMEGKEKELLAYEESLLYNRTFMAEKYREYAIYRIDSDEVNKSLPLLWKALVSNPFYGKTYRTIFYGVRKAVSGK